MRTTTSALDPFVYSGPRYDRSRDEMEIPNLERVQAEPAAGRVAGPCPERGGEEHDRHAEAASAAEEHEDRRVKAADEKGENWGGADRHAPSIGAEAAASRAGAGSATEPCRRRRATWRTAATRLRRRV